ncbi:Branched-chain amino acid transport system ATP-binding protein [Bosea sp. 62]|uniref:ABC transporter ATP-binding protein n=1 Tax=unclassified Bosea (in: a-proteobacteria) TaxID=2653178 RepID=UPI0012555A98|nr:MULTISPECIES: ABC transporter ATP-binding protein [unclassified Bosea (in: a-proteobacteria)]CAD5254869.1 Branched-chain amino acid transport system ATP-binding protein [Bosea sp. 7B]CAD5276057.1 Branched-chain amino acid transport system ATP-binding protein [Bosea sp. 21B]CAD5277130.1 Branched-chain amino acid transport system ATP-binding protein [Bosea sp. 46]VVT59924.1 Branched-chain amino acid transport system ATP-binding protein [Bosea sp. EC-HK365B]VXB48462.1 Branched-chain amino acid
MSTPLLQAKNLRISFYGVQAADGVNLEIREGEFLAIIGPNGSGKTTFLNLCTGYLRPSSGEVYLDGKPITAMAPRTIARRGIARAFQIPQLFLDQSVIENLMIAVAAKRGIWVPFKALGADGRRREAEELLALVGLDAEAGQLAGTLPEGRRKLLDIVIALALKPRLVLLDEPTSGVSTIERFTLMETLMAALRRAKVTALFVEHDMDVVQRYADRVVVWDSGSVMAEGPPSEVFKDERVLRNVVGVA